MIHAMFGILELELSQEEGEEEGKEGRRKGEIEMGHLGLWGFSCHGRRRKGRREERRRGRRRRAQHSNLTTPL